MSTKLQDLSYYRLLLQDHLNNSFPEKANDRKFIDQRASWAAEVYEGALQSGNTIEQSNEIANYILFQGLRFSKFDTVFQVVINEFDMLMADEELRPFAIKVFPYCEAVFNNYELTDDFAYGYEYDALYTEITGTIALWIEENGLQ
ncbi:DUF1896 domain-containing protein [Pedobacter sp. KLB.chiD]|uniref:DUF1896 domain-containing protein n=1 Tax=Pedobacter sp. KLB.chiD TaxID=3387402 RepID=UPI00399A5C1E